MWLKGVLLAALLVVAAVAGLLWYGERSWQASTAKLHEQMQAARLEPNTKAYYESELAGLPGPVQRYFRTVLKDGQPIITAVTVKHAGTFNVGTDVDKWTPFTSTQRVVTRRPGFVWDARNRIGGMTAFVHDTYVAGEASLAAKLFGLIKVMQQPSSPELRQGELMRFFAESTWYPTALLPSQGIRWEAVDDSRAKATLTDGSTTVELVFTFDAQGLISSVRSEERYREVNGALVATPWEGRFWDYQERAGMLVPLWGEVAWILPSGPKPYWRGHIENIEYELAQ